MAQNSTRPLAQHESYESRYTHHVSKAAVHEGMANARKEAVIRRLQRTNPDASIEWIDAQAAIDYLYKSYIGNQQFHVRQATMYGIGGIMEMLASLTTGK